MKLYFNGPILTMNDRMPQAETVLEDHGRILFAGKKDDAERMAGGFAEHIDLNGRTLMPAFLDAHSHITDAAGSIRTADLRDAGSFDEILSIMKEYAAKQDSTERGDFLIGQGYDHNNLKEGRHPDKTILDDAFPDVPVVLFHVSLHMCTVNSRMLERIGIDDSSKNPEGGVIGRLEETDEPNGYFEETAMLPVYRVAMKTMMPDLKDLQQAQLLYLENGILTAQNGAGNKVNIALLRKAAEQGRLIPDVVAYPCFAAGSDPHRMFRENEDYTGPYNGRFRIGGYKVILDGSPQGRSAWMSEPYENSGDFRSYGRMTDEELQACVDLAYREARQILAHCNGDAASEQFLNACERAEKKYPGRSREIRPVMIHCQTVRDDQLDRMAELGMIASIFVDHVYYWGDVHLKNFGEKRGNHISPVRAALDRGIPVNFHTDCPVIRPNLFQTVWTAVNRITKSGCLLGQDQRVSVPEALHAVTTGAAYLYGEEKEKGSLEAGKRADFILADKNPLETDPMKLREIRVTECIREGQTVWTRSE
ncbi:MAG: amidohydrolase [Anaerovoracaceae bacterium]|jgi:predicted amidohydrolase YtcJ